ncbi:ATP-binding protein [Belliella sp. R4-6]|uniref:histidine kinase n=1 Tax=Belliella alkalica TaxID=1730871 RepID=A0ABS9VF11_9BACT|nr:ATP-binding protein [Belliella alkalica]MCH7415040.1 ATP-binding protein [Belliella alkalica]
MFKNSDIFQLSSKVVLGFILASLLVLTVSVVTYISIKNLLETVENLSEPNEKLRQLNGLMADVYLLDMSKANRTSDKDSVFNEAYDRLVKRLASLKESADHDSEIESFEKININIQELLVSYAGLEEVRYRLTNRNFSEQALKSIEIKLQRQEQSSKMDFLDKIKRRDLFGNLDSLKKVRDVNTDFDTSEEWSQLVEEIEASIQSKSGDKNSKKSESDSILVAMKKLMTDLYKDEQQLRDNFVNLEANLQLKNAEVFSEIQNLISNIQMNLLVESRSQNESAYSLTYTVSIVLGGLVFLGVIGSLGFVFSILKEVKKAKTYNEKLEEAKKYSENLAKAKQDFLANMSHEIRNPLHAIQGFQKELEKSNLNTDQQDFIKMIGFASKTLMGVVNDILDFSKLEAGKIEIESKAFDGRKLFLAIKSFFSFKAEEKNIDFNWNIDLPKDKWIVGDELRINQILNNLISNAIKFTSEGSVNVNLSIHDEKLSILVEDTGIGMGEDQIENVFNEFNQGDSSITRRFGGTGLGLSIVKKLVDLQSGEIKVESELQKGTRIEILLPVQFEEASEIEMLEESTHKYSLEGIKILVVDDDKIGLKLIKLILEGNGAEVLVYNGGVEFRDNYKSWPFDLAFIDIQMPEVSGVQVLDLIKNRFKINDSKILAMTANVFANEQKEIINSGFDAILLKPFDEDKIIDRVGEILKLKKVLKKNTQQNSKTESTVTIDLTDLKRFCMGDEELLSEVISDYLESTAKDITNLKSACQSEDYAQIREITHQLSSRLGQIKADASGRAKDIEVAIKDGNVENVIEKVEELIPQIQKVLAKLEESLETSS